MESNPICQPSSANKNEMLLFGLHSTSDDRQGWSMDSNLILYLSPAKERNAHFWITFNFWWSAGLVNGLEPHPPPVSCQKNEMLIFCLCSLQMIGRAGQWTRTPSTTLLQPKKWNPHFCIMLNFWCWPDWSMDSNPIHHPSPTNKMKCLFLDYTQLLMIGWAGWWTQTPSATPLLSKNEILIFGLCSTSDYWNG